jgi:hypothetical protein
MKCPGKCGVEYKKQQLLNEIEACVNNNHCFCKTCWGDYFTNEIETLNRCNNIKCPFLMCDNYANEDDI